MNVFSDVKQIIHDTLGIPLDDINAEKAFNELQLCSLDITELVMALEDEFDIIIPDEAEANLKTVEDLVKIVSAA